MRKAIWFHVKRGWGFIKELGLAGFVGGSVVAALMVSMNWIHDKLPWSVLTLLGLLGVALFANAYHQFVLAHRVSRFDPSKARDLGLEISAYSRDALQALHDWDRRNPLPIEDNATRGATMQWQRDRAREAQRAAMFNEGNMARAVAFVAILQNLEIYAPFSAAAGASSRPDGLMIYLGAIGQLLEKGLIEEARAMNDKIPGDQMRPPMAFTLLR